MVGDEAGERLSAQAGCAEAGSSGKVTVLTVEADDLHVVRGQGGRYQAVGLALENDVRVLGARREGDQCVRLAAPIDGCEAVDARRAACGAVAEAVEDHTAGVSHGLGGIGRSEEFGRARRGGDFAGHRLVQVGGVVFRLSDILARRAGVQYRCERHESRYPPTTLMTHISYGISTQRVNDLHLGYATGSGRRNDVGKMPEMTNRAAGVTAGRALHNPCVRVYKWRPECAR